MAGKKICLGPLNKIPLGLGRGFLVDDQEIAVFRPRSGELHAVHNICPHKKGVLTEGIIDHCQVICPHHGHKFDLKTGQGSEAGEKIRIFCVWEEKGEIIIEV
ncbi:MAG: hypothetical protein A3I75_01345 [Deltaproteobacteria bacterium RIFCSPLOWO2_02_FULL_50_16]|nr:MAG: hypothetical protein A3B79_05270 [Deltaproteobacteria bacterium RIFCSPHIGHO2_02_FULL_50_15]OGQ58030.1 MAG: hypothetical protein A3I75_01345 [Deltaproteobacteria bacterium RIFCSPLOWO2_02_FULL_50_16]OGQ69061.1 MAG: hypothetical protein A3F89_00595 [Deltaproteobacteria bacterium RIFCSPLOWO2_12_FULL_50_11]